MYVESSSSRLMETETQRRRTLSMQLAYFDNVSLEATWGTTTLWNTPHPGYVGARLAVYQNGLYGIGS